MNADAGSADMPWNSTSCSSSESPAVLQNCAVVTSSVAPATTWKAGHDEHVVLRESQQSDRSWTVAPTFHLHGGLSRLGAQP